MVKQKKKKVVLDPVVQYFMDNRQVSVLRDLDYDIKKDIVEQKNRRKAILLSEQVGK